MYLRLEDWSLLSNHSVLSCRGSIDSFLVAIGTARAAHIFLWKFQSVGFFTEVLVVQLPWEDWSSLSYYWALFCRRSIDSFLVDTATAVSSHWFSTKIPVIWILHCNSSCASAFGRLKLWVLSCRRSIEFEIEVKKLGILIDLCAHYCWKVYFEVEGGDGLGCSWTKEELERDVKA